MWCVMNDGGAADAALMLLLLMHYIKITLTMSASRVSRGLCWG